MTFPSFYAECAYNDGKRDAAAGHCNSVGAFMRHGEVEPGGCLMQYASTTTLAAIRAAHPCEDGWRKLLGHLGKTAADDESLPLLTVLDSNGLDDALWVLSKAMPDDRLARHFGAWCADQVLHLFEAGRPDDLRPRQAISVARDDGATAEQLATAEAAAGAAAWAAARAAQEKQLRIMLAE